MSRKAERRDARTLVEIARDDTLLTPREAAEALAVSVRTLRRWRSQLSGPSFVKVGSRVRYRLGDVLGYLRRRRVVTG